MSTLAPALVVLPVLGLALPLARLSGRGAGTALFQAVSLLVLLEYVFGLAGALRPGSLLLLAGGTLLFVLELARRPAAALAFLREPAPIVLCGLALAHAWLFADARYAFWDEFDQWGLATRELVLGDALYGLASNVSRPTAPPAAAVWHYFVCRNLSYGEGATYTANFLLFLAPLLPLYDGLRRFRLAWSALASVALVLATALFTPGAASVMVDHVLASFVAGLLMVWLQAPDDRRAALWLVAPGCVLALLKESGLFLALCALAFVPLHRLVAHVFGLRAGEPLLRGLVRSSLLLAAPLLAVASWQARVAALEGPEPAVDVWSVATSLFAGSSQDVVDRVELRRRFAEVFVAQTLARSPVDEEFNEFSYPLRDRYAAGLGTAGWLLLSLGLSALGFLLLRDRRARAAIVATALFWPVVLGTYLLLLFDVYATDFGAVGIELPGYVRYVNTLALPMVLVTLALAFPALPGGAGGAGARRLLAVAAVLLGVWALGRPYLTPLQRARDQHPFARMTESWTRRVLEATGPRGRVFVNYPRPGNFMPVIVLRYQLTPLDVLVQLDDVAALDQQRLLEQIGRSDFAWFLRAGSALTARLAEIEPARIEARSLHRVTRRDGALALELLRSRGEIEDTGARR